MPLIYITGAPGSGKSRIQYELSLRGATAYDLDDPHFGGPYEKATDRRVTIPPAHQRDPKWFDRHEWRIDHSAIERLKHEAGENTVYLCGVAESDDEIIDLFDKTYYLHLDDLQIQARLANREGNDYGRNKNEVEDILMRKQRLDVRYATSEAISIDATLPPEELAERILSENEK